MCCDLLVGRGAESFLWLSCLFDVRFDWQGIKIRWLSISDLIGGQEVGLRL